MPGQLNVYGLGSLGVNVDKNPLNLEDGEMSKAQNVIHDASGSMGGIRKRTGLIKLNSGALTGSVVGIVNVPLNAVVTRKFYIAVDQAVESAHQWITSVDEFGASSTATTPAAGLADRNGYEEASTNVHFKDGSLIQLEDLFIYPSGTTPVTLRIWDGTTDRELIRIPPNPAVTAGTTISIGDMILEYPNLYFISIDREGGPVTHDFRVFEYDLETGILVRIGEAFGPAAGLLGSGGSQGLALAMHQGSLYLGTGCVVTGSGEGTDHGIYRIRPDIDSSWTKDFSAADQNENVSCLQSYKGLLYAGQTEIAAATVADVLVRSVAGVYASSTNSGVGTGAGGGFSCMKIFGDNLYVCGVDANGASSASFVKKFDGTSWSTVLTMESATASPRRGVAMLVHDDELYVLAADTGADGHVYHTSDGAAWSDFALTGLTGITSLFSVLTT